MHNRPFQSRKFSLYGSKHNIPTAGNSPPNSSKCTIPTTGKSRRKSQCDPVSADKSQEFYRLTMNNSDFLIYIRSLQIDKHILAGKRGSEENIKIKIILPLLQALGWDILEDMDFEFMGADIVLCINGKPSIIIETKSWDELITKHLPQCFEYTLKLKTPWVLISSGQDTALYCSLLSLKEMTHSDPLIKFSFDELISSKGESLFKKLALLIGKGNFIKGHHDLSAMVSRILSKKGIVEAEREFTDKASKYRCEIKAKRITKEEFNSLSANHPKEVRDALIEMYGRMENLTPLNSNIRIRHRSKEIGIEYKLHTRPRNKIIGLFGIYPESAHIAFGLEGWLLLKIS